MRKSSRLFRRAAFGALTGGALLVTSGCAALPSVSPTQPPTGTWSELFAHCMNERGWVADIENDGGVVIEWTDAQQEIYSLDSAECSTAAGSAVELSTADYEAGYRALLDNRSCIVDAGYPLPEAPSFQTWRDMGAAWNPFADLPPTLPTDELADLIVRCPPAGV